MLAPKSKSVVMFFLAKYAVSVMVRCMFQSAE